VNQKKWQNILLPSGNEDHLWELFHENSKVGRFDGSLSDDQVLAQMVELHESLPFVGLPVVELPRDLTPLKGSFDEVITSRVSVRDLVPSTLTLENLATILHYAYGETRDNKDTGFPRPFRIVPSGGGLYPLELFFCSAHIEAVEAGLYHYNPSGHQIRRLNDYDKTNEISKALVQPDIALSASLMIFITAIFERSVFKYGDRGYRFTLLEAGHIAQNINLVSNALGLGSVNIGGYFDREIDDLIGLDGVTHSTIYMAAVGRRRENFHAEINHS
jgi:SagB-type dehydrogenase family enzyme